MKSIGLTLTFALILGFVAPVSGQPIDVMITGQYIRPNSPFLETYREACAKEGVNVHFILPVDYTQFSLELMKKFHVVVFHGEPAAIPPCKGSEEQVAAFRERLDQYRRMGGGILWEPTTMRRESQEWNGIVGKRYGVKLLAEDLYDPAKLVDLNPGMNKKMFTYLWTTDIAKHPVTEGVTGLFLPRAAEYSWPGTVPAEFGPDWQVLVRAMNTTRTIGNMSVAQTEPQFSPEIKGSVASSPAIVGAREGKGGEGRMLVFPIYSAHTYQNLGHFVFNDALMKNGADGHSSDGHRLLLNAYHWLAAPAQAAGLGGYPVKEHSIAPLDRSPVAWSQMPPLPKGSLTGDKLETKRFPGLIGVKSEYGGGSGSVAQYAAVAKQSGLSFLVFLDDVAKLSPEGYQKLVKDCANASGPDFMAIPGYSFIDVLGNSLFAINAKHTPDRTFLNSQGRVQNYWDLVMQDTAAGIGLWRLNAMPVDPSYFVWITCAAPYTWENDRLVDNGFERYRTIQGLGHAYAGVAIAEVSRPEDLKIASQAAHQTIVHASALDQVRDRLTQRAASKLNPIYVTNGPRLERWAVDQSESDSLRAGGERFRLELSVTSDSKLKEITIVDCVTGKPYRTFKPTDTCSFSCTIDESHKMQRYFIPVVTDVNGRTAVGSTLGTIQSANKMGMMSDRLMGMHHSVLFDEKKQANAIIGGWLGGVSWVKRTNLGGGYPGVGNEQAMRIFGFDGGMIFPGAVDFKPTIATGDGEEPIFPGYRFLNRLASYDIALGDFDGQLQFDKPPDPKLAMQSVPIPTRIAEITSREWAVRPRLGTQTSSNAHEITVKFKRATTFNRFNVCTLRRWDKAHPCHWFIRDAAGEVDKILDSKGSFSRSGILRPGDYLFPANEIGGPRGIINLGPSELNYTADGRGANVFLEGKGKAVQPGDTFSAQLVCFARDRGAQDDADWLKKFINDFGIGAAKPGYSLSVSQGKLQSTNYAVDLTAVDGGATLEIKKYDLPHNVPVRVGNMADNAIAGRYNPETRQLLILPVFEGKASTCVNTTLGDAKLYTGELFHCNDAAVLLSAVQDGADKVLVEIHNPTDKPRNVQLTAVSGFTPLNGLNKQFEVAPFSSVKTTLETTEGTLKDIPHQRD